MPWKADLDTFSLFYVFCLFVNRRSKKHSASENNTIEKEPKSPLAKPRFHPKKRVDTNEAESEVNIICNISLCIYSYIINTFVY